MEFIRLEGAAQAADILAKRLATELEAGHKTLWLVTGGSNITISVMVIEKIRELVTDKLTIGLTDERYGPVGNPDSNWQQLLDAGFVPGKAKVIPVLSNSSLVDTVRYYGQLMQAAFEANDVVIGQFGMGTDGHIAGVLPGSSATKQSAAWTFGYDSPPFVRLTLTLPVIAQVNAAYLIVFGKVKLSALENLQDKALTLEQQPAQVLRQVKEAYVINDQLEGKP